MGVKPETATGRRGRGHSIGFRFWDENGCGAPRAYLRSGSYSTPNIRSSFIPINITMSSISARPYGWPHDGSLSPKTTALLIVDMQNDCKFSKPSRAESSTERDVASSLP